MTSSLSMESVLTFLAATSRPIPSAGKLRPRARRFYCCTSGRIQADRRTVQDAGAK